MKVTRSLLTRTATFTLCLSMLWATRAAAHNVRADLAFWGNFGADTTHCQQVISHAAARCVQRVLGIRTACMGAEVSGAACDSASVDAAVDSIRSHAGDQVAGACSADQLQNLRYIDVNDAINDITNICRDLDTAASSATYAPALVGGAVVTVDATTQACLNSTAAASNRLLRYAIRARQRALNRIAAVDMGPSAKLALVAHTAQQIAKARALIEQQIAAACPEATFTSVYNRSIDTYLTGIAQRADCLAGAVYVQSAVTCPTAVCGNGMQEPGEECDDGNTFDGDGCKSDCTKVSCQTFASTYDMIQHAIFENHGCTSQLCHGAGQQGGLDLRADVSYQNLIDVPAGTVAGWKRVESGSKDRSLLWINLAALTLPDQFHAPLRGMPLSAQPLSTDELEAMRLWIEKGGASRTAAVDGTAQLLSGCLPEPKPAQVAALPAPAPGEGVQMRMPALTLAPQSEQEVCFSTYYDFTGQIPASALSPDGTKFYYKEVDIRQDPLSHHLIINIFRGAEAADDPAWGPYSCMGGPKNGQSCDPLNLGFCGDGGDCGTTPDPKAIACVGFGPQNSVNTLTNGGFVFAQSTAAQFLFPDGVYNEIPVKGVLLWNSHAFNLTHQNGRMEAWVNIFFPKPGELQYEAQQIFNASKIFWSDHFITFPLPSIPAFQDREVCQVHRFGQPGEKFVDSIVAPNQTAHLFELSSHMHQHGKRFRIFRGAFTCTGGSQAGQPCSAFNPEMCPGGACTEASGRDPQASLLYTNYVYNDPVILRPDPPILISGAAPAADRSLTFCAHYDNGLPPNLDWVKRRSTSAPAASIDFGVKVSVGGPCAGSATRCIGGPHHNELCHGDNANCDSSPGAGDGDCDACPLTGGMRTTDEMFILFGNYWLE